MLDVLKSRNQINQARAEMKARSISAIDTQLRSLLRRLHLLSGQKVGDEVKSWDVLRSTRFIEENLAKNAAILDIGAFSSEMLVSLSKLGFANLHGIDLNPGVLGMPGSDTIQYKVGDFMQTPYPDASFDAITAVSVIEHGYAPERLLAEISRLLKPGGYFLASFDYWPEKIDTTNVKFFGMEWLIFSKDDVQDLIYRAETVGLSPFGHVHYEAGAPLIDCAGKQYTFAWLALKKR